MYHWTYLKHCTLPAARRAMCFCEAFMSRKKVKVKCEICYYL